MLYFSRANHGCLVYYCNDLTTMFIFAYREYELEFRLSYILDILGNYTRFFVNSLVNSYGWTTSFFGKDSCSPARWCHQMNITALRQIVGNDLNHRRLTRTGISLKDKD